MDNKVKKSVIPATPLDPLSYPLQQYPVVFIDYIWVISIYVISAFSLAVLIDGYIVPPFNHSIESTHNSWYIGGKILLQLGVQGFIAVLLCALLQKLPSPVNGFFGYDKSSSLGLLIRNPAIISVMLITLSSSLRQRLMYLFSRYDMNAEYYVLHPEHKPQKNENHNQHNPTH